jgi:large subunit ribosomal protein L22
MANDTVAATARLHFARVAPRKVRLVADMIRGRSVGDALRYLQFTEKRSAPILGTLLKSAIANATQADANVDVDLLVVRTLYVDGGPTLRRYTPRAHGRATRIRKRTSHITLELATRT